MSDAAFQETARARRRQTYFRLNSHLAQLDNQQLYGLLAGGKAAEKQNRVVKLGSTRIFVKRVPVTYLEYIHMHSTANYYDLPSYFNFGGCGGGLGVFREIATHIKTTNWVLGGEIGCSHCYTIGGSCPL